MRDDLAALSQDHTRPFPILGSQLLEDGVTKPQVDVPTPQPLVRSRRDVSDRPLVHLTHTSDLGLVNLVGFVTEGLLLQTNVIEPRVVKVGVALHLCAPPSPRGQVR